jgi:hypothetical protein
MNVKKMKTNEPTGTEETECFHGQFFSGMQMTPAPSACETPTQPHPTPSDSSGDAPASVPPDTRRQNPDPISAPNLVGRASSQAGDPGRPLTRTKLKECQDTDKRYELLREIELHLSRLRRDDYRAGHLKLRQDQWDHQVAAQKRADRAAADAEQRREMLAWFQLQPELKDRAQKLGGSDEARDLSALVLELEHNLRMGCLDRQSQEFAIAEEELDDLKQSYRNLRAANRATPTPVPQPARPQTPDPTPGSAPTPRTQTPDPRPDTAPVALANDCTPEEFAARSTTPTVPQSRSSRRCSSGPSHVPEIKGNQVKPSRTNP